MVDLRHTAMTPAMRNVEDCYGMHPEPFANCCERQGIVLQQDTDGANVIVSQSTDATQRAAFPRTILHVVNLGSGEDVRGIDARGRVAGVTGLQVVCDGTNEQDICRTVSGNDAMIEAERSVPAVSGRCLPHPAFINIARHGDLRQKSTYRRNSIKWLLDRTRSQITRATRLRSWVMLRFAAQGTGPTGYTHRVNLLNRLAEPRAFTAPRGFVVPHILPEIGTLRRMTGGIEA